MNNSFLNIKYTAAVQENKRRCWRTFSVCKNG